MILSGSYREDPESAEADPERSAADRAGGDSEEHVSSTEEDDKGTDRVVDRAQVHGAR